MGRAKLADLQQVELTPENLQEVAFKSGRSVEELRARLEERFGTDEAYLVWVFEGLKEGESNETTTRNPDASDSEAGI